MDFTKLRAAALKDGDDEEAVTVNTRALIDKVLARYSGEWTTLRELLQNAADAQATSVTIKFETLPSAQVPLSNTTNNSDILKHVLLNHTLRRLLVTNNGQAFGVNDWSRLKRIAEGNPDETKIGAFGVGFYSVFADCEEPFVSSGNEAMAFYWKGNSLFTRRLQLPAEQGNPDTSFVLDYRNTTTPMPNLLSIAQFLATSLTFVALQNIELWVDDWKIISLQKKAAPSISVPIARDVETKTKEGLMQIRSMERESVQMDATFMNVVGWKPSMSTSVSKAGSYDNGFGNAADVPSLRSFFSRLTTSTSHAQLKTKALKEEQAFQEIVLEDLTATTTANVFLRVTTAHVKTSVASSFASELERATKKPPPKTTKLAILTSSYDETAASTKDNAVAKRVDIFASVLPGKKPGGRIFIGFPTHQTTGAGMHLSAPSVIPTVERESIDLNARWVRTWNIEMLRVAGIMARLAFAGEMADLSVKVKRAAELAGHGSKIKKEQIMQFMPEALHTLTTFTFGESTPSSQVSHIIEEAFWTAYKKPFIEIYSTRGVLPTTQVRLATEDLSGFVEGIPVVPEALVDGPFVEKLKSFGLITEITISDVKKELEAKALSRDQLIQFIGWAGKKAISGDIDGNIIHSLLDVAVATVGEEDGQGDIVTLGSITNYLEVNKIPPEVPIPPTTIPFQFTRQSKAHELQALGWEPLEIVPWLRYLIESNSRRDPKESLTSSPKFAAQILLILSRAWDVLSQSSKGTVISLLDITIVPTKFGMKKPGDSFFPSVKLFDDLPTVTSCPGVKEKFLAAIGVRKTVDLETIFSRLLSPAAATKDGVSSANSRHVELIKYLVSVKDDIPAEDIKRLKNSQICPAEAGPKGLESTQATSRMYRISELFEPKEQLRDLKLPILQWPGPPGSYRSGSNEGRFLSLLGLRSQPSVPELIEMMASDDLQLRNKSMIYFIANHQINGYASFDVSQSAKPFLPLEGGLGVLVSPTDCFTNAKCAVLGFNILANNLHLHANKFGVAMDPPITECVNRLISKPPQTRRDAATVFSYFSTRLGELGQNSVAKLGTAPIVPVVSKLKTENGFPDEKAANRPDLKHLSPRECYVGTSQTYGDIFEFVDFGAEANSFLMKCGSKVEPTKPELASMLCREPARLLGIMQTPEKYMTLLRGLADDLSTLKKDKLLFKQMMAAKFLLGAVEIHGDKKNRKPAIFGSSKDGNDSDDDIEEASIKQYKLASANQIVIVDDYYSYRLFKGSLMSAPEEEKLEDFYYALGTPNLSSLVQDDLRVSQPSEKQEQATRLRGHLLERAKLFLHEWPRHDVKHDARWLDKNLSIQVVGSISLRRSLTGHALSHTEKRSAAVKNERGKGWTLYITEGKPDSFQISRAMSSVLLERPSQQSVITLETFLNLNLLQLRDRGYNVERILRAKAAEQRIAEEERKKQLQSEQMQIREQEEQWRQANQDTQVAAREQAPKMPGAFDPSSPEYTPEPESRMKPKGGLFSGLKNKFLNNSGEAQEQLQKFLGNGTSQPAGHQDHDSNGPPSYDDVTKPKGEERVSNPHAVQQNLLNAIQSSRAYNSSTLFSPPATETIKEQATYCDTKPAQNLTFLADASNGMRIFVSKDLVTATDFLSSHSSSLNTFASLILEVANIYGLPRKALHIYYDEQGSTIAFNSNGSVFCNFRFYYQLHQQRMDNEHNDRAAGKVVGAKAVVDAMAYWWTVIAHELAHNLVKEHNSEHSFYTEMLIANYFTKMMEKTSQHFKEPTSNGRIEERSLMD